MNSLTPRQAELISLLANGYTSRELRDKMGISQGTVDFHIASIKTRLSAKTREEAVAIAVIKGMVTVELKPSE